LKYFLVLIAIYTTILSAQPTKVIPISKTKFIYIDKDGNREKVDMTGKDFILVSVREKNSDGRFYAVDRDATVWLSSGITSGIDQFTPSGIWKVLRKHRYHMSKAYPDEDGINNMDYSLFFTNKGHAIHQGSMTGMSHGCIHVHKRVIPTLFNWAWIGIPVITTRESYMKFAKRDLKRIYRQVVKVRRRADHSQKTFKR
jgi:lipoprotein-anchoring transpeptidase ErfK/SrfK